MGQTYVCMAESIRDDSPFPAGFDAAVSLHGLLEAIERSAHEGRTVELA